MKIVFRLLVLVLLVGGWVVAAGAMHVVRTAGDIPLVGGVAVTPKQKWDFKDTYIDVRNWSAEDFASHTFLVKRLIDLKGEKAFSNLEAMPGVTLDQVARAKESKKEIVVERKTTNIFDNPR